MLPHSCPGAGGRSREVAPAPGAALDRAWSRHGGSISSPKAERSGVGRFAGVCGCPHRRWAPGLGNGDVVCPSCDPGNGGGVKKGVCLYAVF